MNSKVSILLAGLLACSMQAQAVPPAPAPPPLIAKESKGLPPPRICQLGSDCLTMDSRPFEMCQVSGKSCGDKLAEVLQVQRPKVIVKPAPLLPVSR